VSAPGFAERPSIDCPIIPPGLRHLPAPSQIREIQVHARFKKSPSEPFAFFVAIPFRLFSTPLKFFRSHVSYLTVRSISVLPAPIRVNPGPSVVQNSLLRLLCFRWRLFPGHPCPQFASPRRFPNPFCSAPSANSCKTFSPAPPCIREIPSHPRLNLFPNFAFFAFFTFNPPVPRADDYSPPAEPTRKALQNLHAHRSYLTVRGISPFSAEIRVHSRSFAVKNSPSAPLFEHTVVNAPGPHPNPLPEGEGTNSGVPSGLVASFMFNSALKRRAITTKSLRDKGRRGN
jgi:hypothetical protein